MLTTLNRSQLSDRNNDFPFHNPDTDGYDCNVAKASECVELVTKEKLPALEVRKLGGDLTGGTGSRLARRVFASQGMVAGTDYQILNAVPTSIVRDLLRTGWYVVLYVKYDVLRDNEPNSIGDGHYSGAHAVGVSDFFYTGGTRTNNMHDPLNDGGPRASLGHSAPKGIVQVRFKSLKEAAWAYSRQYEGAAADSYVLYGYAVKPTN
jgi:hypothetical protein